MRGLAALSVMYVHWFTYLQARDDGSSRWVAIINATIDIFQKTLWNYNSTHPGVIVFLVLSGFVIHHGASARADNFDWRAFYKRRFLRIYPTFAFCALIGILVHVAAAVAKEHRGAGYILTYLTLPSSAMHIVASFFPVIAFVPYGAPLGNEILETVLVEMMLYAAYPAIRMGGALWLGHGGRCFGGDLRRRGGGRAAFRVARLGVAQHLFFPILLGARCSQCAVVAKGAWIVVGMAAGSGGDAGSPICRRSYSSCPRFSRGLDGLHLLRNYPDFGAA